MKSKLVLSTTIAIFTLTASLFADDAKYPPINPALTYWQAASFLPELKDEKSSLLKDTISGKIPFDAVKVNELVSQSDQALRVMAKAAASSAPCYWGLPMEEGPAMPLPHISKVMELSRLAVLKADALFAEGKVSEGIDWLLVAHRTALHAGAGEVLISVLVQNSIESMTINAAGQRCLGWDEETRKKYVDGLKALPPLHTIQEGFGGEFSFIDWFERLLLSTDPQKRKEVEAMMGNIEGMRSPNGNENDAAAHPGAALKEFRDEFTPENSAKRFADMRDIYRRTQEALGKPWEKGQPELEALGKEAAASNVLLKLAYPAFTTIGSKGFEIATLRTMLDAALQYGPKLDETNTATFNDAFVGEPLVLKKADDGSLSLTTSRQYGKKPLVLKLGK